MQIDANPYGPKISSEHLRSPRNKKWKDDRLTENMHYRDTGHTYTIFFNIIFFPPPSFQSSSSSESFGVLFFFFLYFFTMLLKSKKYIVARNICL